MKIKYICFFTAVILFISAVKPGSSQDLNSETFKIGRAMALIDAFYVDSVDLHMLNEKAIIEMLKNLDPHSVYISAKDVKETNEPLNGNFEGIGIQFNILRDSIIVIEPIPGGPSEKVGLQSGDKIITINGEKVTGIRISTTGVKKRLMGPKGTKVEIEVFRRGEKELLDFTIIRDKIPINSLDASYMLDDETAYIKLNKFAATTLKEFSGAVDSLKMHNMKNLVLDLRGNPGGYMLAATDLADVFFRDKKLLVYLEGRKTARQNYNSSGAGSLSSARIAVLTDEGSASASEILSGALQDWDRGVVVGRRTFGKGLVQNGFSLPDGSQIRLTIARYYTPAGRLIQSPYNEGYDKYMKNIIDRYYHGEMMTADSIHFPDSLKYKTLVTKRTVYGGGGIMPDLFVPADTLEYSDYYRSLVRKGILNSFTLYYFDRNRKDLVSRYTSFEDFRNNFEFTQDDISTFIKMGEEAGAGYNESQFNISRDAMLKIMKGLVASNIWRTNEYFMIVNEGDAVIANALKVVSTRQTYNKLLGYK
jgi:carboxyl-terminal processing protease